MVLVIHFMLRPFRLHGRSIQLPRLSHGKITYVDHLLNLSQSFPVYFPHFISHQHSQVILIFPQGKSDLPYHFTPFRSRDGSPLFEGLFRLFDDNSILLQGDIPDFCNYLTVDRRYRFGDVTSCVDPFCTGGCTRINILYSQSL